MGQFIHDSMQDEIDHVTYLNGNKKNRKPELCQSFDKIRKQFTLLKEP